MRTSHEAERPISLVRRARVPTAATVLAAASVLALLGSSCGDTTEDPAATEEPSTTTVPVSVTLPEGHPPMTDLEFGNAMLEAANFVGRVGADRCGLDSGRYGVNMPDAANPTQIEWSVYVVFVWIQGLEDAYPEYAEDISATAIDVRMTAEELGYPVGYWDSPEAAEAMSRPGYQAAMRELDQFVAANCSDQSSTTIPIG